MRVFLAQLFCGLAPPLLLASCATMGPPQPPSLDLPKPPSDLRAARKGDRITLTWTVPTVTTDRQTIRRVGPTRICRGVGPELKQCEPPVGEAPGTTKAPPSTKRTATYTDVLPLDLQQSNQSLFVTYAVEVLNQEGGGAGLSNQVRVPSAPVLHPFSNFAAEVTAPGVRISWTAPSASAARPGVTCLFRLYRRQEGATTAIKIADLDLPYCPAFPESAPEGLQSRQLQAEVGASNSYLDQTFEWQKTYFYRGTMVSVISEPGKPALEIEGDDTPEIKVFADDIFPPAVPSELQAAFSGPGQEPFIDLVWGPVADADLDGYNVYRHEEGAAPVKLNTQLVKTPSYRDTEIVSGRNYFYSVSAVDLRGNESARSEEASERVP